MNRNIELFRRGLNGDDRLELVAVKNGGHIRFDVFGNAFCVPPNTSYDNFELIPAAALAAGKNHFFLVAGTGTEVIGRATKGGVIITSQATTPADDDTVYLAAVAEAGMTGLMNAKSLLRLSGVFSLASITGLFGSIGITENVADADPSGSAGDGVTLCWAPDGASAMTVATGLAAGDHANLIVHYKVGGTDTFVRTDVTLVAGLDYYFVIEFQADLTAKVYINGTLVATTAALTTATALRSFAGIEVTATDVAQKSLEVRHLMLERTVG